jgi:MFS superfamily sulfate permease-like transporter
VITNQFRRILGAADIEKLGLSAFGQQIQETMASSVNTTGYFAELIVLFKSIPYLNLYSVAVGLGTMVFIRWMKKSFPRIPAALLALVLMTGVVAIFSLDQKGIQVLGAIPSGLPSLSLPHVPLLDYLRLLPGAIAVVAITLCEGLLLVRSTSRKHNTKADGNQVLFGYGMAALTSGVTGALIMSNSPSRTAAVDAAGSRTQISSLVGAAAVALIMLFFTDLLAYLPTAALAGVVAAAVLNLIEIRALREFWHMRRSEFWVALVCLISVLVFGPLQAVLIAFLMATIDLLRRASRPRTWVLQQAPDSSYFVPEEPGRAKVDSDIIIYRFGSSLYFANAAFFENEVEKLLDRAHPPIRWLVLDAQAINDVDITGAEALEQVSGLLKLRGVTLAVSRVNPSVAKLMDTYHLTEVIGKTRFFSTNRHAIGAFRRETGQQTISETSPKKSSTKPKI